MAYTFNPFTGTLDWFTPSVGITLVFQEIPLATNSGLNVLLTLTNIPVIAGVYRNGQRLFPTTDYTVSSNIVTVFNADDSSQYLVDYTIDSATSYGYILSEDYKAITAEDGTNLIL